MPKSRIQDLEDAIKKHKQERYQYLPTDKDMDWFDEQLYAVLEDK